MCNHSFCRKCHFKGKKKKKACNTKSQALHIFECVFSENAYVLVKLILNALSADTQCEILYIFHNEACFPLLSWLMNLSQFTGIFFELLTPKLNTLFYFGYKSDKHSENNISNLVFLFQQLKIYYLLAVTSP